MNYVRTQSWGPAKNTCTQWIHKCGESIYSKRSGFCGDCYCNWLSMNVVLLKGAFGEFKLPY